MFVFSTIIDDNHARRYSATSERITVTSNKLQRHQFICEIGVTGKTLTGTVKKVLEESFAIFLCYVRVFLALVKAETLHEDVCNTPGNILGVVISKWTKEYNIVHTGHQTDLSKTMPVHLSEKSLHISWCLVWGTSMFPVLKGNVATNEKDCLPFISSVICTAFTHIIEQEQLTVRQTQRTQMTVVLMVHLFAGWRSWFLNHKLSTFSPW